MLVICKVFKKIPQLIEKKSAKPSYHEFAQSQRMLVCGNDRTDLQDATLGLKKVKPRR